MESDIYNICFYRGGRWVTPHAKYGCLPGVFRRFLLDQGLIDEDQEDKIVKDNVKDGEFVILCNGAQGCRLGKIALGRKERATQ
jgi:branched-subunit amino acid aminotransferase/4-amino-4-deoxychorismate lyase